MNILVLNGSPRPNGNTAALCKAFAEEAAARGHEVTVMPVGTMQIGACRGCEYCHTKGQGTCVQKDDMEQLYPLLQKAELLLFASPVHYFGFSGQMQSAITRFYSFRHPAAKKCALLLSSFGENMYDSIVTQYRALLDAFEAEDLGILTFHGRGQRCEENMAKMRDFADTL